MHMQNVVSTGTGMFVCDVHSWLPNAYTNAWHKGDVQQIYGKWTYGRLGEIPTGKTSLSEKPLFRSSLSYVENNSQDNGEVISERSLPRHHIQGEGKGQEKEKSS